MEKKEEPAAKEEKKAESEFEKIPKIGEPTTNSIFPGLVGVNEHASILSFLSYKDLIKVTKTCRQGFNFIMDETLRRRILHWKPDKEEETRINNYILSLIQAIDIKE